MVAPRRRSLLPVSSNDPVARDTHDRGPTASGQAAKNASGIPTQDYADRVKLAQHLHDQGINPLIWTQAQPAPFAEQEQFRKTGQKPRENQFEVNGRLYDATPALAATPAQAKVALDTYRRGIGDRHAPETPPLDQYVEIDKVPLQHPYGAPFTYSGDKSVDAEVLRNFIRVGVDPKSAHLGDPLPAKLQAQIKEMLNSIPANAENPPPNAEASDPSSLLYRGADGWIYAKNEATRERDGVQRIRTSHAEKRATAAATPADDDEVIEEIARYYGADMESRLPNAADPERSTENPADFEQTYNKRAAERLAKAAADMPYLLSAIEKSKAGQALSNEEQQVLAEIEGKFAQIGLVLDPAAIDLEQLKSVASIIANTQAALASKSAQGEAVTADTRVGRAPLHVATQGLNDELAQALVGSTVAWAQVAQNGPGQALMSALMSSKRYGRYADLAKLLGSGSITSISAAQIAQEWAEQEGSPDIFSPYTERTAGSVANGNVHESIKEPIATGSHDADIAIDPLEQFRSGKTVSVRVGNTVIRQSAHTTATDQIFIEEFLNIARSRGCEPEPDHRPGHEGESSIYGGTQKPQRRITDIDQRGHNGSVQPDGTVGIQGNGGSSSNLFNSMTTGADQITGTAAELLAAKRMIDLMIKQLNAPAKILEALVNPVKKPGHVFLYGKKWLWELEKIRNHLRRKLDNVFDKYFIDCEPNGPPTIIHLDDPDDPEFSDE